jgi:uncharacterized protein YdeI (YjbR/CyaY-like superfamily)
MYPELEGVYFPDRTALRAWLIEHHATASGIFAIYDRGAARRLSYEEIVLECLCFGWIDSKSRRVDEQRTAIWLAPRKANSGWASTNKARVIALSREGLMTPAGQARIDEAQASGSWDALNEVEAGIEPTDLIAALEADPLARAHWDAFSPSARKAILLWIAQAKTNPTRARRVATTVSEARENRKANEWKPRASS